MKKLYLLLVMLVMCIGGYAQTTTAAAYTFSAFSSTYSSIASASGTTSTTAISGDDLTTSPISLGFNFVYCGTTYTSVTVCSNAWISLSRSSATTYTNTRTGMPGSGVGLLMAYWDDLHGSGHRAYYSTTGTSPNRVFTFEWNNFHTYAASGNGNIQVKLYETSNIIDFCYGSSSYSGTSATIGIANSLTDYQNLNNMGTSPAPSTTTYYTNLTGHPTTNQVYRWAPICLQIATSNDGPTCSGDTLNLAGNVTIGTATSYAWSGPGGFTSTDQNPSLTGVSTALSGTYTLIATNGTCYDTDATTVVIDSTPTATISGTSSICSGGSSTVNITGTVGSTVYYQINGGTTRNTTIGSGGVATLSTGTLSTGSTATTYTYRLVSATMGSCSRNLSDSAVITVNPVPPAISGASSVCVGGTATVFNVGFGTWSSSNPSVVSVSGGSAGTVYGVSTGSATITYTLSTGCYVTGNITTNPAPSAISGPRTVCPSATISLGSVTTGGSWSSGTTSVATVASSGVVTGVTSGYSIITYTLSTGCYVTDTITVNPLPAAFSGPSAVCPGSGITLSSTPTGGTWSSGSTSIATIVASTGALTGISAGSATITYTAPTSCKRTGSITVYANPATITGTTSLCEGGGTTNLYNSTTGGTWSSSNTALATVSSSGLVTGIRRGTLTITYTVSSTGCYTTTSVIVNPLPSVITGPSAVCASGTVAFSDSVSGGTWSSSNSAIASVNGTTGDVSGVSAGSTDITYFLGTGCIATKNITVNPLPAAIGGTTSVCEGGSTTNLSDATAGGTWSSANTTIASIDATGTVTGLNAGTTNISYILSATGCGVWTAVTVNPLPPAISGPAAVCVNSAITLSNSSAGGSWSSGTTSVATISATGSLTGIANGTTTITYTLPTGCIATKTVTVNPLPAAISGTPVVCAGLTTTFSDATASGTWSTANSSIASVNSSGIITGVAAGTTDITYQLGTGCQVTRSVTVNPLPGAISGAYNVCQSFTTVFANVTTGGTWSSGNTSIASISASGLVTGVAVGTTVITYTLGTGCLQTQAITVDPLPVAIAGATNVCVNSNVALSDGTSGGSWSTSDASVASINASSGMVTGVSAGTATITYMLPGGCYITMTMTVNPLPAAISGTPNVCEGSTVALTDASGTGTWSSSNTSLATIGATSGVVSGITAGSLRITFTLPTGCLISSAFVVNPTPAAITGTMQVCEAGATTTLADALSGGNWTSANTSIATAATSSSTTGTITGVSAGTVTITYSVGTCFNTATVTVNALPGAVVTPLGDTMLCPGGFVALSASYGTGYSYQWFNASGAISGATDDYYIATTAAPYRVTVFNTLGCRSVSIPMLVSVNPAMAVIAAAGATTICNGSSATLNANTGVGLSYQWTLGGSGISGATGSVYYATTSGAYNVIVSNMAGCSAMSTSVPVTVNPSPSGTISASGPLTFCSGDSVTITATAGSGLTYQWQNGGVTIAGATDMSYTARATGNYEVAITNAFPCTSISSVAAVNTLALPSAVISTPGATTFCTGGTVVLNVPAAAGNTYQWRRNGSLITGAAAATYTVTTGGDYTAHVISTSGCNSLPVSAFRVDELTVPVLLPMTTTTFCWGSSALLGVSVSISTGVNYQWQLNGVDITGATNNTYSAGHSGNYACMVSLASGCASTSTAISVTEYPLPNPTITFDGVTLQTEGFYRNYAWFRNGIPVFVGGSRFNPTEIGSYSVKVEDSNGCLSVSNVFAVTRVGNSRQLGVANTTASEITIYPNPALDVLHIGATMPLRAVINSLDGRTVLEQANASEINISQLADGIYMLRLFNEEGEVVKVEKVTKK